MRAPQTLASCDFHTDAGGEQPICSNCERGRNLVIYFIGGAPRSGKSTLCQRFASSQGFGWISTDLIAEILREAGIKMPDSWDARPGSVSDQCERFFPFFDRFVRGVRSMTEDYVFEGVDFFPRHVMALEDSVEVNAIFLGRSEITLEAVRGKLGKSPGYAALPEDLCRQITSDVPRWSSWIEREAKEFGYPYIDMADGDFDDRLEVASSALIAGRRRHMT